MNKKEGESVAGILICIAIAIGIYFIFHQKEDSTLLQEHPNYESYEQTRDCGDLEPENPYDYGSGHYAGFEWGENGNYCSGNSDSFVEGCEEYENQEIVYEECIN